MQRLILGRIIQAFLCLLVVITIVFFLLRLTGDPIENLLGPEATSEDRIALTHYLGLDKPIPIQYVIYVTNILKGDFGQSIMKRKPVLEVILSRAPATLQLAAIAIPLSLLIALPIGVYAAVRRGTLIDKVGRGFAFIGQSFPGFWLGILLIWCFAVWLGLLPAGGRSPGIQYLILPAFTLAWHTSSGIMRLTRSSMLDVLGNEYIKMARIKGLSEFVVIWKHAFKNAAIPVLTFSILLFVTFLAGTIVTETVFAWPGVGRLALEAIHQRDFPVVQGVVIVLSTGYLLGNLLADILYAFLNPKIRYQKK